MKNILTREELLEAKKAFNCKDWTNPIQEILNSTNDENIEIEDKYLDSIKEKASWKQIKYCKSFNLDLKWSLLEKAKEFVLDKISDCEVVKIGEFRTYYQKKGKTLFILDSKSKEFWVDYDEIGKVLEEKYSLKYKEMREIMDSILEKYLKSEGYTPCRVLFI